MCIRIGTISLILSFVFFLGCAKQSSHLAISLGGVGTVKSRVLKNNIKLYFEKTKTVKALAFLFFSDGEEERQSDAALIISRPDSIRVDMMDSLADVWASTGSNGEKMWLFIPNRSKLYSGRASKKNLHRLANFDWELSELVSVMAGSPPIIEDSELLQVGAQRDGHFVEKDGSLHIWADVKNGRVGKCARYSDGGSKIEYSVDFSDYRNVNGTLFPYRVEAIFPNRGAKIIILYNDVTLNQEVNSGLFVSPKGGYSKHENLKD